MKTSRQGKARLIQILGTLGVPGKKDSIVEAILSEREALVAALGSKTIMCVYDHGHGDVCGLGPYSGCLHDQELMYLVPVSRNGNGDG